MLRKENKVISLIYFLSILLGCVNSNNKQANLDEIKVNGFKNAIYISTYKNANDSITFFIQNNLLNLQMASLRRWEIDSMLCFNTNKDRCVILILEQGIGKEYTSEAIEILLGEKINANWYFFLEGSTLYLPRDMYTKDIHNPLPFSKLSEIAHKELMGGYLKRMPNGKYEINDAWVNSHFEGNGWCDTCKTRADYERLHYRKVVNNWKYKTTITPVLP